VRFVWSGMDYNELKQLILQSLSKTAPLDSSSLAKVLIESSGTKLDIHAVRMALMRYYKLGLLSRQRIAGIYRYGLTERGVRRLTWLKAQSKDRN
jgi:DNA-binding transcriptional regulator PaaX